MSSIQVGRLRILFGVLCDPLAQQVRECGLRLDPSCSDFLQGQADAIAKLGISGVLPDSQVHKCRQRLMKKIMSAVSET